MYISSGVVTDHVQALLKAALLIEEARSVEDLSWAVSNNLGLWLGLSASASDGGGLDRRIVAQFSAAAQTVIRETVGRGRIAPCDTTLQQFAQMNRRIAAEISAQEGNI